jgi:hypothetical protein
MIGIDTTFLIQLEILETIEHGRAMIVLEQEILAPGIEAAIAPQVIAEFLHIATDAKRFREPLTMERAIERARFWWNAREIVRIYPTAESLILSLDWMARYRLGRKRVLDTQLAAAYVIAGIERIITSNARDFAMYPGLTAVTP